ncbi:MAG TPA: PQQ-binding-like beta-propeller repeat protein [Planctomycetota bacterium]|nr:PQQ-binding-like beta-propeller repeat protein [Planctomycetota bacterium]
MLLALALLAGVQASGDADWPMWRRDAGRTARSPASLPEPLHLQWSRALPPLTPAFRNPRLQFDRGYEPVVAGKTLFVGSSRTDAVVALDTDTGRETWRFTTDGPVRFAPAVRRDRVFVGSDDGHLYCLDAASGARVWSFRAVPSNRKVLGNGRLISVWPVRGGPVVADDRVYFAAGVWPMEGVFVYALDAATGRVVWLNDRTGHLYGIQPHAAEAIGGLSPQGYLVVDGDDLHVPCGTALPATFDRRSGALKHFALPRQGRLPGGWFAALDKDKGLVLDPDVARERHEDKPWEHPGVRGLRSHIVVGGRAVSFAAPPEGVAGRVHTLLAADGKLFVVTEDGMLAAFGVSSGTPIRHATDVVPLQLPAVDGLPGRPRRGYGFVWGVGDGTLVERLAGRTELHVVAIEPDAKRAAALRERLDRAGLYGTRAVVHAGDPSDFGLPPYAASLVLVPDLDAAGYARPDFIERLYETLRPYGGEALLPRRDDLAFRVAAARLAGARLTAEGPWMRLVREGALPGATNYVGGWSANRDDRVRAPLGVLWYDDEVSHFKRSPQPFVVDGVMVSQPKEWLDKPRPYALGEPVYTDVYTGRVLAPDDPLVAGKVFPLLDATKPQPQQYRPPTQKDAWKPAPPRSGERINPMTGEAEPRVFPKSYGCDGGVDYGHVYTMRSGTPAFYDKRIESGTIHVGGPRSGCTNSIIPANGVLSVPYFYDGCTCSYPLPTAVALASRPPSHEQWATWGPGEATKLRRVGVNLGAPGDRMTEAGTLWLDYPAVGGPSPALAITTEPPAPEFYYRHSVFIEGGAGWPWVAASGARGLRRLTLSGLRPDLRFTVRLTFADPDEAAAGRRVFAVHIQGEEIFPKLDVAAEAGGRMRSIVKELKRVATDGTLVIELTPRAGEPILSGVELVADGLPLD